MKTKKPLLIIAFTLFFLLACQLLTNGTSQTEIPSSTETPQATPTLEPISEKSLAGLIVYSPTFGNGPSPFMGGIAIWGLGIVNQEGELIKFADSGLLVGTSENAPYVIYQAFDYAGGNGQLRSFNAETGETVNIEDNLDGDKNILVWIPGKPAQFIYSNDLLYYLFEAYGYFDGEQILMADASTGEVTTLLEHTFQSAANPERTQIAYTTGELIYVQADNADQGVGCFYPNIYDISTGKSMPVNVGSLSETPTCMGYPQWSPDGKKIAWVGYFSDQTARVVVFDTASGEGKIYGEIPIYLSSQFPSGWNLDPSPEWIDEKTLWTANYEVDVESGETSTARELTTTNTSKPIMRPDGRLGASLHEGIVDLTDMDGDMLASYPLLDLYTGDKESASFDGMEQYSTFITGWSATAPAADVIKNVIVTPEPTQTAEPTAFFCPGAPKARLKIGDKGRVTFTDGTRSIMRSEPVTNAGDNSIDRIPEGTEFEVVGGPVCYPRPGRKDAYVYWQVLIPSRNNIVGWLAEGDLSVYFLEPIK